MKEQLEIEYILPQGIVYKRIRTIFSGETVMEALYNICSKFDFGINLEDIDVDHKYKPSHYKYHTPEELIKGIEKKYLNNWFPDRLVYIKDLNTGSFILGNDEPIYLTSKDIQTEQF